MMMSNFPEADFETTYLNYQAFRLSIKLLGSFYYSNILLTITEKVYFSLLFYYDEKAYRQAKVRR
jgi:hypothetical protein